MKLIVYYLKFLIYCENVLVFLLLISVYSVYSKLCFTEYDLVFSADNAKLLPNPKQSYRAALWAHVFGVVLDRGHGVTIEIARLY